MLVGIVESYVKWMSALPCHVNINVDVDVDADVVACGLWLRMLQVKTEAAKFDMERDEFMNVDGEAEFDVDIMKELRYMRYRNLSAGDVYRRCVS